MTDDAARGIGMILGFGLIFVIVMVYAFLEFLIEKIKEAWKNRKRDRTNFADFYDIKNKQNSFRKYKK